MSQWLDKPDADGLWWRCNDSGSNVSLCMVRGKEYWFVLNGSGLGSGMNMPIDEEPAKWQPCQKITPPEPYKPPTPPKVEWFTGWRRAAFHYIAIIGDRYIAIDEKGYSFSGVWNDVGEHNFATVRKMESPP